jgi:hypothetical protein
MAVDYRLLPTFQASSQRHHAARNALPKQWRLDPRPEVQDVNESWVAAVARVHEQLDRIAESAPDPGSSFLDDR